MSTDTQPTAATHTHDLRARKGVSRYAAHAGDTETWIDAAAPTIAEAEKLHAVYSAAPELLEALRGILEIGKRDMSNPKYDGYFETAKAAVAKATGASQP